MFEDAAGQNRMRQVAVFAIAALFALGLADACRAEETCRRMERGQFFDWVDYCVSSFRSSSDESEYGPQRLAQSRGESSAGWCADAGETVEVRVKGGPAFRRIIIGNGYARSAADFAAHGRVKLVEMSADSGFITTVILADQSELSTIPLPALAHDWIRFKIVSVYAGQRHTDACLSFVMPDFEYEEELLLREQGLLPNPQKH